jgi:hypothetical protein
MKRWLILFSVGCLVIAGTAVASVHMGDTELGFMGSVIGENSTGSSGLDFNRWALSGRFGYFTTDNIQVSAVATFEENEENWDNASKTTSGTIDVKRDTNIYALGGQIRYHFMTENQLVPYIGAQLLWADVKVTEKYPGMSSNNWEEDKQGILWGPLAGVRYEMNEQNDCFIEYQYQKWSSNISDLMDDGYAVYLGLIHRFK